MTGVEKVVFSVYSEKPRFPSLNLSVLLSYCTLSVLYRYIQCVAE